MEKKEELRKIQDTDFGEIITPNEIMLMDKFNQMVDIINEFNVLIGLENAVVVRRVDIFRKFQTLEEDGIDIYAISLRKLGDMVDIDHPQTVKDELFSYMKYKLSKKRNDKN